MSHKGGCCGGGMGKEKRRPPMDNKIDLLRRFTERGKEPDRERVIERGREYQIRGAEGRHYILHVVCGTQSFHPEDVQRRYCGYCREFLK